jgi:hypothetical protein
MIIYPEKHRQPICRGAGVAYRELMDIRGESDFIRFFGKSAKTLALVNYRIAFIGMTSH